MKNTPLLLRRNSGFSLVELLVVLGILGIIIAISITNMVGSTQAAQEANARANARQFSMLATAASAAGNNPAGNNSSVTQAMQKLKNGVVISSGALANKEFKLPNVSAAEMTRAEYYLDIVNNELTYMSDRPSNPN
jgi:prepilin-type N-terminal cleavage/methylation domain-containing protein